MTISSMLIKPTLDLVRTDLKSLNDLIEFEGSDSLTGLKLKVHRQLNEVTRLEAYLSSEYKNDPHYIHESLKKCKRDLRFTKRAWERYLSNHLRAVKVRGGHHVVTVAA